MPSRARPSSTGGSPTNSRSTLACVAGSRPPAPTPTVRDGHRRLRAVGRGVRGEQGRPGRRAQLPDVRAARSGVRRDAAEQLGHGGRRHRHLAVRAAHPARADGDRRDDQLVEPEVLEPRADADDVGDRVEGADLVEVHVVGRGAVHRGLRDGQPLEASRARGRAPSSGSRRVLEQRADVAPGAVGAAVGDARPRPGSPRTRAASRSRPTGRRARGPPRRRRDRARLSGTPAPTRAPSSMSPLAPEDASTQPITPSSRDGRGARRCGPPGPRRPRRRTRCRCSRR